MQTTSEHITADVVDATTKVLTSMHTCELMEQALNTPELSPNTVALLDRLASYAAEIDRMEDAMRAAGLMPRKQCGKVVDMRTRRTKNAASSDTQTRSKPSPWRFFLLLGLAPHLGKLPTDCLQTPSKEKPRYLIDSRVSSI